MVRAFAVRATWSAPSRNDSYAGLVSFLVKTAMVVTATAPPASSPGKHRPLQVGHTGVAAGEHLAELIDHRRRRRMAEAAVDAAADHPPLAFRNGDEVDHGRSRDIGERNAVDRCDLCGVAANFRLRPGP